MSFTASANGSIFSAGDFLVNPEECTRESATIAANHSQVVTRNGRSIVPAGAIIPSNGSGAKGILYEDIDVTDGAAPGSIVTEGKVYETLLPAAAVSDAKTALKGIIFMDYPNVVRPSAFAKFATLTVTSVEGASSGKTSVSASGYVLGPGESYVYKTHATTAPAVKLGDDLSSGWTALTSSDITATTGHKITVAVKDANSEAVGAGSTQITSHA